MSNRAYAFSLTLGVLAAGLAVARPAAAQLDTVTVAAGSHYAAGPLQERLLGTDYRDLWVAPIRVPVLSLGSYAGGLTPVQRGGGKQTISLRFRAADGREFNFRSVDKDQGGGLHPDFRETLVDRVAQDQVHSKHPAAGVIAGRLMDAAGVLHPGPVLFVMPDDPRLGEFREEFAGMLGTLEIHPNEREDGAPGFAGARRVVSTERLLERLEQSPTERVDAREYLRARLLDLLIGDWDRHVGQWRWAGYQRGDSIRWVPVPEDRDNAFSDYDGLVMDAVRSGAPLLVRFSEAYPDIYGLTANASILDRQLLSELPREQFDALARELQGRITDEVIREAALQAPAPYHALRGEELIRELRARRDALPDAARRFYELLASQVDVWGTDAPELAEVQRVPGALELRVYTLHDGSPAPSPFFQRRFVVGETEEVRLYLRGGDDRAVVRGGREGPQLRVIGGAGDDVLADSAAGGRTALYDHRGDNRLVAGPATVVNRRAWEPPQRDTTGGFNDNTAPFRDWGSETRRFLPLLEWRYNTGPVVGGGPVWTRYGFRREPYARQVALRGLYAPLHTRFGVELSADVRHTNAPSRVSLLAEATQISVTRFHGYGNDTPRDGESDLYKVWETRLRLAPLYHRLLADGVEGFAGPVLQYTDPDPEQGGPAALATPLGADAYGQVGAQAGAVLDRRDLATFPRSGFFALLRADAFPAVWGAGGLFGGADAQGAAYLPLPLPLESTLAVRAGGRAAWGDFPLQQAAFLGGSESLRGFPRQRFAGDRALFGGAELRTFLTRINFISRGDLGVLALADAGRVWVNGESEGGWHTGVGAGVWVGILDRTRTFSVVVARGEETALYLAFGVPF